MNNITDFIPRQEAINQFKKMMLTLGNNGIWITSFATYKKVGSNALVCIRSDYHDSNYVNNDVYIASQLCEAAGVSFSDQRQSEVDNGKRSYN